MPENLLPIIWINQLVVHHLQNLKVKTVVSNNSGIYSLRMIMEKESDQA